MLSHYLGLALRNVARTKLYAVISVTGLAIGFATATLIGLYVRDELSYESWIPNSDRIYQVSAAGPGSIATDVAPSDLGQWLAADYPQFEAVTRLFGDQGVFARGDRQFNEPIVWADASVFGVFQFPVVSGRLDGALDRPDTLVLTRKIAEKYFGSANAVGKTLVYNNEHAMVVTAVIENLPSNTHLNITMLGAARSEYSHAAEQDRTPLPRFGQKLWNSRTYFLLKPNEPIESLRASIATLIDRHAPESGPRKASEIWPLVVRPIRAIHLNPGASNAPDAEDFGRVYAVTAIGLLTLLIAAINFVNLFTSLGARRALAVGVRKALGASQRDLFLQFMIESFLYVAVGALMGLALAALALQPLNRFLLRTIHLSTLLDLRGAAGGLAFLIVVGLLAGVYPATVLSAFRPATVTRTRTAGRSQAVVRQSLVVLQFGILIALLIATLVIYRQTAFGMREALRQNTDTVVLLQTKCTEALIDEIQRAPGVLATACTQGLPQLGTGLMGGIVRRDVAGFGVRYLSLGFGFLELYGFTPVAGRFFSPELGTDSSPSANVWTRPEAIVINETAARQLGFGSAADAVGQTVTFTHLYRMPATFAPPHAATIIGVVEDFQMGTIRSKIDPAAFFVDPAQAQLLSIKLNGRSTPESLEAIDRIWREQGGRSPAPRFFFQDSVQTMYLDLQRQTTMLSVVAGIAVLIAVLGLVGLAAHAATSRVKEIGIRKTLGGNRWAITGLLLWQFSQPVLLANVIAWPTAYFAMSAWLQAFARRIELDWWMFVTAAAATMIVAVVGVFSHTWAMAGMRPVDALRYE
jgi:putative ABC transport system permease protein